MNNKFNSRNLLLQTLMIIVSFVIAVIINKLVIADLILRYIIIAQSPVIYFVAIVVQTIIIYLVLRQIINRRMDRTSIMTLWVSYFLVFFVLLFLRTVGIRGLSLNPFSFLHDIMDDSNALLIAIMNVAFFIPVGYLFKNKPVPLALAFFVLLDLGIETTQYLFSRGFFDLGDITLNTIGFSLGYFYFSRRTSATTQTAQNHHL